jgi:K+-sensing histidine kinase KdpD
VDEDMARRVLINLMENASKFTHTDEQLEVGCAA